MLCAGAADGSSSKPRRLFRIAGRFEGNTLGRADLTDKELAEYLRIDEITAYRPASERKFPEFRVGGS